MTNISRHWATPIIRDSKIFEDHETLLSAAHEYTGRINNDQSFTTADTGLIDDPRVDQLKSWILNISFDAIKDQNKEIWKHDFYPKISDLWSWCSNDYYNPFHSHPNSSWSGVYCLEDGDSSSDPYNGSTLLFSPLPWGSYVDPGLAFMERMYMQRHMLKTGDLLIFPSYIRHSARYYGEKTRSIIAFNLIFPNN